MKNTQNGYFLATFDASDTSAPSKLLFGRDEFLLLDEFLFALVEALIDLLCIEMPDR